MASDHFVFQVTTGKHLRRFKKQSLLPPAQLFRSVTEVGPTYQINDFKDLRKNHRKCACVRNVSRVSVIRSSFA